MQLSARWIDRLLAALLIVAVLAAGFFWLMWGLSSAGVSGMSASGRGGEIAGWLLVTALAVAAVSAIALMARRVARSLPPDRRPAP